ncbi:Pho91p KNAG_0D00540 [Huiozyma naganishii CBS 8797]|uniref:SPX domain-containing protein n=1 Tax=Huiozyma naganishii (strain ATCC MYA-139 / BCRC 22969 / CBS 8797 / KCTC 17520 / NBRC 10181 / NCYC 3082 / Yp74L-3) TaxID=1071383 RepID=J7S6J7_HUIN7|nr:hypothetical protein KNAG_0D00540 [Kazachstania naganishii CBS 8797]CCK69806.1 hypothetical protein KNAG_0D00540 [Kazachstania naganishii CBS 8797]
MKFSHSLQFNAVPEWQSKYIAYSHLKKLIYTLQREKLYSRPAGGPGAAPDEEQQPLLAAGDPYVARFVADLDYELRKIDKFFISQETGLLANYSELRDDVHEFEFDLATQRRPSYADGVASAGRRRHPRSGSLSSEDSINSFFSQESAATAPGATAPAAALASGTSRATNWGSLFGSASLDDDNSQLELDAAAISPLLRHKLSLKKRMIAMFTQLSELREFIELNRTGFAKICKKFDKSLNTNIKRAYVDSLPDKSHVFKEETLQKIKDIISETIAEYAKLQLRGSAAAPSNDDDDHVSLPDYEEAEKELSSHLRDHVVWERNTVWKDMMNLERKYQNAKREDTAVGHTHGEKPFKELIEQRSLRDTVRVLLKSHAAINFTWITLCFLALVKWIHIFDDPHQQHCFAILLYASLLWATETIPLFVTSLLVPFLIVLLPVLKDPVTHDAMDAIHSSQYILSSMWSSVIMLLLGGFTLAAALSKYNIAKVLSTYILSSAGTNPQIILLTNMGVALFVSMWVSNVAAPVLCYSIIQPLLRTLPSQSSYSKSLILGIALASNIGGMASPIASPQNIFSFGMMSPTPSWGEWFLVSIPVCIISIVLVWIILLLSFPRDPNVKILQLHPLRDPFTATQWFVAVTSLGTIILWCMSNQLSGLMGEMGIISIIPMLLFFGTGLLSSDDFNNFMWTIVVLAMGGSTLGKAVSNSGLLSTIALHVKHVIEDQSLFVIVVVFGLSALVVATFVSHTVAAMILVPLMGEIGENLPEDHSRLLIMITAMLCSCAMGLPTSGFPNVTAISMIDEVGDRYLNVAIFISRGVPASLFCYAVVVTVGYGIMRLIGF